MRPSPASSTKRENIGSALDARAGIVHHSCGVHAGSSLSTVVTLIVFVVAAYLLTRFVVGRLQHRFVFVTGIEYVVLGVLLGPAIPELGAFADLTPLGPVIALAAGWVGLLAGMQIDLFRASDPAERGSVWLAIVLVLATASAVAAGVYFFLTSGVALDLPHDHTMLSAGVLGCAAAGGSSTAVRLLEERYKLGKGLVLFLRRSSELADVLSIVIFGVLFCVFHRGEVAMTRSVSPIEWVGVTLALGGLLGLLFTIFLFADESPNSRFLALVGIIAFASGAAFFLRLSPLLVNLVLGTVLVCMQRSGQRMLTTLVDTVRPLRLILLVFAGALWVMPPLLPTLIVLGIYVVLRAVGRLGGAWFAALSLPVRGDVGRGLLAQGDVALAMAISFRLVYEGPGVNITYSVIIASVLLHEMVAPRVLRRLLIDAGEVRREVEVRA